MSLVPVKRTLFVVSDIARNASLPNGSRPGTIKITSSAIRLNTVSTSPVSLAFIQVATKSRMARSSSVMASGPKLRLRISGGSNHVVKLEAVNVGDRQGSKEDRFCLGHVQFTPESGHR